MFIIKGYKLIGKDVVRLDEALNEIKELIHDCAEKQYYCLLSQEIETMVDEIVLGRTKEPQNSIFDEAVDKLNRRIGVSMAKSLDTEYNLSAGANVFTHNGGIYIELCTKNLSYVEALAKAKTVKEYHVEQVNEQLGMHPEDASRYKTWKAIMDEYSDTSILNIRLYPCKKLNKPEFSQLSFCSKEERAEKFARYRVSDILLGNYACGENIPPEKLMEYMDCVLSRLTEAPVIAQIDVEKQHLMTLLPEITEDMIFRSKTSE